MKRYYYRIAVRIFWVLLSSTALGFCAANQWKTLLFVSIIFVIWAVYQLFVFQIKTVKDVESFISAIRYSEFNISFSGRSAKGLAPTLIPQMENSIKIFSQKLKNIESEHIFYGMMLDRIDFGILAIDGNRNVTWINRAAADLLGKPLIKNLAELVPLSDELPETLFSLAPAETKIIRLTVRGQVHQIAATSQHFFSDRMSLKLVTLKNIRPALEESESDAWKKLIRILTHEIMNSLAPIISLSDLFSTNGDNSPESLQQAMQTINRRGKGIVGFVNNYRQLTHIPEPIIAKFSAREWMEDVNRLLAADGYRFSFLIEPENIMISADRNLMEQAIINLIRNACESSSNQPKVEVKISYDRDHHVQIAVSDTGDGIATETLERIFVPFFTTKKAGSGIGLSVCRQIVNLHGGVISVESTEGAGSCFTIYLASTK
jgi:signal transduction histidine kinase